MKKFILTILISLGISAFAQNTPGTPSSTAPSNPNMTANPANPSTTLGTLPGSSGTLNNQLGTGNPANDAIKRKRHSRLPTQPKVSPNLNKTTPTQNCDPNDFACMQSQGTKKAQ